MGTLDEALARFTAVETLDKANRYQPCRGTTTSTAGTTYPNHGVSCLVAMSCLCRYRCSKCKELVCAKKQLTIYKPPNVCIVQFKRCGHSPRG